MRLGEIRALRQRHLDLLHRTVRIEEQFQELADRTLVLGPPKTDAGVRTVSIPQVIVPDLGHHVASVPLGIQHATQERDAVIADKLISMIEVSRPS